MRNIVRQIIFTGLSLLGLYLVILVITLVTVPSATKGEAGLSTANAASTLYMTDPKYVVLNRAGLDTPVDKVVIVGASNMMAGFPTAILQPMVPGAVVHNLAVGGANMTEVSQVVDLVQEVQSPTVRAHNIFVIGMWYGMLCDNQNRWKDDGDGTHLAGETDIDTERYRYGFYRRTASGPVAVLPPAWLPAEVLLIHPYLVLNLVARDLTKSFRLAFFVRKQERTDAERNASVLTEAQKRTCLDYWWNFMGKRSSLSDEQVGVLEKMVDKITDAGGKVVLIDLPLPLWHSQRSPYFADYQTLKTQFYQRLAGRPGITILEMQDANSEDDFSDEVHPKPRVRAIWAQRLADTLNPLLSPSPAK